MEPTVKLIPTDSKDLIHDVAYDYYGRRFATASNDASVKIWDLGENGEFVCTANWKAHDSTVWRVTWAHPEFGQVLATCSFNHEASVWEETGDGGVNDRPLWKLRVRLKESRTPIADVKFAPRSRDLGMQLATISADGVLRVYKAPDIMNLSQWSLIHDVNCKTACSSLSWCLPWNKAPLIAISSNDAANSSSHKVLVYEYSEQQRKWLRAATVPVVTEPVYDLSFAPNFGRSFQMLAISSRKMHIVRLTPVGETMPSSGATKFDIVQIAQSDHHATLTWRLSWNVTGTVLTTCSDDGFLRLWMADEKGQWRCVKMIKGDGSRVFDSKGIDDLKYPATPRRRHAKTLPSTITHASQVVWH